jgi:glycosyltransferase involved in cell wall biosynthesis
MTIDSVGGVWRYGIDLADGLKRAGIETLLVCLGPGPSSEQLEEAGRVSRIVCLDQPLDWTVETEHALLSVASALETIARAENVDLLHLNAPSQAWRLRSGKPVVTVSHSCLPSWFNCVLGSPVPDHLAWHHRVNREGLMLSDAVVTPSESHAENMRACYGSFPNLHIVPNAVRPLPPVAAKKPFVLAVGRWWDKGKNGRVIDEAAIRTAWPLKMAGATTSPSGEVFTVSRAKQLGEMPNAKLRELMSAAEIFASSSLYEPFGLAALEAAHSRAALVLSDIPTYRELWEGAALFAKPDSPASFSQAINRLIAEPELRRELVQNAYEKAQRLSPGLQVARMLNVYAAAAATAANRKLPSMV